MCATRIDEDSAWILSGAPGVGARHPVAYGGSTWNP